MGRESRILIPNAYYHIFTRGQRKNPICFSKEDFLRLEWQIFEAFKRFDTELNAYCIMRNHFHLLVKLRNDELWKPIHRIKTLYALCFNAKYCLTGHVFQGRYKSYVVLNEKYLTNLINYIHNNPVKESLVESANQYLYSSAKDYAGEKRSGVKLVNITNSDLSDNYPFFKDIIGNPDDYTIYEKRTSGRIVKITRDRRLKDRLKIDTKEFALSKNIDYTKLLRRSIVKENNKLFIEYVNHLFSKGYTQAEIARQYQFSEGHFSKLVRKCKK